MTTKRAIMQRSISDMHEDAGGIHGVCTVKTAAYQINIKDTRVVHKTV